MKLDDYYTLKEFAKKCGVEESTVRQWRSRGKIKFRRMGQMILIPKDHPRPTDNRCRES